MKIAININELTLKNETGVKTYTREIVKALGQVDKKNEYLLYANCRDEALPRLYGFDYKNFKLKISKSRLPFWTYLKFPREIKKDKPDVLFMPIQATPFFRKPKNIKIIITVHDLAFLLFPKHFTFKDRFLLNFHTRRAVQMADKIIAPSEATKRDIIRFYDIDENKIKVIYHGVDDYCHSDTLSFWSGSDRISRLRAQNCNIKSYNTKHEILSFRSTSLQDDNVVQDDKKNVMMSLSNPYILFVGTIQPRKNIIRLIEAFEILKNPPNPLLQRGDFTPPFKKGAGGIKLIIAGNKGWLSDEIYKKAKESKFSEEIIFKGNVSDEELADLYKNATIFVLPSLYEGFGLPVLEAMSYGVPCVVSDNSSLSEIANDSALLVDANNSNDIAEKINILLNDEELRKDLSRKGIENAKRFSWIKSAKETLGFLESN